MKMMMKRIYILAALAAATSAALAETNGDTIGHVIDNVVVTGTRSQTDVRHLPMTLTPR